MSQFELDDFLPHEFIGISMKDLRRLPFSRLKNYSDKLVVQQSVTFRNKRDFNAHRLLRAIDNNVLLSKLEVTQSPHKNLSENMNFEIFCSSLFPRIDKSKSVRPTVRPTVDLRFLVSYHNC